MSDEVPPEVVVEDDSKDKAYQRAADLLQKSPDELNYTILQEGSNGFMGFFQKSWRVKAKPKQKRSSLREAAIEDALEATESVSGSFSLKVSDRDVLLTVYPPEGSGDPVDPEEVITHLTQIGLTYCDFDRVRKVVNAEKGQPEKIGGLPDGETIDTVYNISVSEDELQVEMKMIPPRLGGDEPSLEDVERKLNEKEITEGIKWDVIEEMIHQKNYNESIVIAEGRPPEKGRDGKIEYHFDPDPKPNFAGEEGQVDFREMGLINNVKQNEILAEKINPAPGRPGLTVRGDRIEAPEGKEVTLQSGKNVRQDNDRLYSEIDGQVTLEDSIVQVFDLHKVQGDVDYGTGNIVFDGTVIVEGNVKDRFRITASGDIIVEGSVGKAYLESKQNIIVNGGIRGKGSARVSADGSIMAEFVEQANLFAGNHILVSEMILHSNCDVRNGLYVAGGRGLLAGGKVRAGQEVYAKEIGSIGVSETKINVGIDPEFFQKRAKIESKIIEEQEKLDKVNRALETMKKRGELSDEEEAKLKSLGESKENLERNIENYQKEKENLSIEIHQQEDASVMVEGNVFAGTCIQMGRAIRRVRSGQKSHCGFRKFENSIEFVSFEHPTIPSI